MRDMPALPEKIRKRIECSSAMPLFGDFDNQQAPDRLMTEVSAAGEDHGHTVFVAGGNDFFVFD